jgi:hypothetical protein
MADNVAITAGSGTSIATDDVAGVQYQRVKLTDGTADSSTVIAAGGGVEAGALRVTVASDSTGVLSVDDNGSTLSVDDGGSTLSVDDGGASLTVDGTVGLAAGTNNIGDVDVLSVVPGTGATSLGKAEDAPHSDGDTGVLVLAVRNHSGAGSDGDYSALSVDPSNGGLRMSGCTAHDAVDAGSPMKIGAKAVAHGTNPTAVAAADRTDLYANRAGVLFVIGGHPNVVTIRANYTGAQTDTAIVSVNAGSKIVVTRCSVTADKANTVDVQARVGFGATNTPTTTGVVLSHPGIAAGSGVVEGNGSGILGIGGDAEDLRITSEVPTTGSIDVVVSYYTIES